MNLYSKELINESINILEDYRRENDIERATELINTANSFIDNTYGEELTPYVSLYTYKTRATINDDIIINFYATDYLQSDYIYNNTCELILIYSIDGVETIKTIYSGDNSINFGKITKGEHEITLQVIDKITNLYSNKLFFSVLIVDELYSTNLYQLTLDDIDSYNISIDNDDNKEGLNNLFNSYKELNYEGIKFPENLYLKITCNSREDCLNIPNNFTIDMNWSTFKLNMRDNNDPCSIVSFIECYNSHLINGVLEGDKIEREENELNINYDGEAINTIVFNKSKFCSIKNIRIKNTTGHVLFTIGNKLNPTYINNYSEKLFINNGVEENNPNFITTDYISIPNTEYFCIGKTGGSRTISSYSPVIYVSFYDSDKNYIGNIITHEYRKIKKENSYFFIRISFRGIININTNIALNTAVYSYNNPENIEILNCNFYNTRTTCIAPNSITNLLVDSCTFEKCGYSITPSIMDFEDCWCEGQDIFINNCERIGEKVGTIDIIDNVGYNHVYTNNINFGFDIRSIVFGFCLKNNISNELSHWVRGTAINKFGRIINNEFNNGFYSTKYNYLSGYDMDDNLTIIYSNIQRGVINCVNNKLNNVLRSFKLYNVKVKNFYGGNSFLEKCDINPTSYIFDDLYFKNCNFYNFDNIDNDIILKFNQLNANRKFEYCNFNSPTYMKNNNLFNSGKFINCIFNKETTISPGTSNIEGDLYFKNCNFEYTVIIDISINNCYIVFDNCLFKNGYIFKNYGELNSIFK